MYVPPCVVQRICHAGVEATIGVARCYVTVLFVDLEGFKEACQDIPPGTAIELLAGVLDKIANVIEAHGGTLLEFIADEVLAVFNAPNLLKNHAAAVVASSLDIHAAVEEELRLSSAHLGNSIHCRCGVNTAPILAGNLGSTQRMKYGLLGDGVNLAARLKGLNSRYGTKTLVNMSVLEEGACEERFLWRPVDVVAVKGKKEPTTVYEAMPRDAGFERGAQLHNTAFKLYQQRRFKQASARFQDAYDAFAADGARSADRPTQLLRSRCLAYIECDPGPDWDGVDRLNKKTFDREPGTAAINDAQYISSGNDRAAEPSRQLSGATSSDTYITPL
jgi:adenylate cyclase